MLRDVLGYRAAEVAEKLETSEASVNSLLRRARTAFEARLPVSGRERAPLPDSKLERDMVGRFAVSVESGDIDGMVALLTDDAWLTMPPLPHAYQGHEAIGAFLRDSGATGARLRVAADARQHPAGVRRLPPGPGRRPTRRAVRAHVAGDRFSAITWFADGGGFERFGLPQTLANSAAVSKRA